MEKIIRFFKDEDGLELSEYAVMGTLIILTVALAVVALEGQISAAFNAIASEVTPP